MVEMAWVSDYFVEEVGRNGGLVRNCVWEYMGLGEKREEQFLDM